MFEILVYLFENYTHVESCPEPDQLARKLSAAGFEEDDISAALEWLSGLEELTGTQRPSIHPESGSVRAYSDQECARLDTDCRGFLLFLENAGVLNALTREMIIERAMASSDITLSLAKLKVIVLMVLWTQHQTMDTLILEELLSSEEEPRFH